LLSIAHNWSLCQRPNLPEVYGALFDTLGVAEDMTDTLGAGECRALLG
jgi:hypothetical protein